MREVTIYEAEDGTRFTEKEQCARYEVEIGHVNAVGEHLRVFVERCLDHQNKEEFDTTEAEFFDELIPKLAGWLYANPLPEKTHES
jgi:hypothetical protein